MNKFNKTIAAVICLSLFGGCTTRPTSIPPTSVSPILYDGADCTRLANEAMQVDQKLTLLSADLESSANADAAFVAIGFLLWPIWFATAATGGAAKEQELGNLKGQKEAIQAASINKKCGLNMQAIDEKASQKMISTIEESKVKCEALGLKPNTENFGKCVLQLSQ